MSKEHRPPHRNPRTKEMLENKEQVCTSCFENFRTTEAGDKHRESSKGIFACLNPRSTGLQSVKNDYGTVVWRVQRVE